MTHKNTIRTLALAALIAVFGAGQGAYADTSIKESQTEGTTGYNALQIVHGCETESGKKLPVIAQSVVFPTQNPTVTRVLTTVAAVPATATTAAVPAQTTETATTLAAEITDRTGLAGKADLVQDKNIFNKQKKVYDANGNLIGFNGTRGNLDPNLLGLVPFRFTPVTFKADSCARRVLVQIAVADICKQSFPPKAGTANLWIPAFTGKFTDTAIEGIGAPAVLTIKRNTSKALPAGCPANADKDNGDKGYDVVIAPSAADVDAHLPIRGYWGR